MLFTLKVWRLQNRIWLTFSVNLQSRDIPSWFLTFISTVLPHPKKKLSPFPFRHQRQFYKRHLKINELSPFNCGVVSKQQAGWQESRLVSLQVQEIFLVSVAARLALKLAESRTQWLPASSPAKEKRLGLEADLHLGAKLRTRGAIPGVHKFSKNLGAISKF